MDTRRTRSHAPSSPLARLVGMATLFALIGTTLRHVNRVHADRRQRRPRALPERLQVWEGEGGQSQMFAAETH